MALSVRAELVGLLERLKDVRSPLGRIKLLTRGWKTLRRLDRAELRQLAADVGFDGAEDLLAQLSHGKGLDPHVLIKALRAAREVDAEELQRVQETMQDPDRRALLMSQGIDAVADVLDIVETEAVAVEETGPEPPAPLPEPPRPAPPPAPVETAPLEPPPSSLDWSMPPPPAPAPPPATVTVAHTPAPPAEEESLLRRLRRLREELDGLRSEDQTALRGLIESFPPGWARRRALTALLEARIPSDPERALELLDSLESPVSRRWCLATIRDRWALPTAPGRRR